jgi:biopolymer transport protein ExbB
LVSFILLLQDATAGGNFLTDNFLVNIIREGGYGIMIPLFLFSVITIGILVERLIKYFSVPPAAKVNSLLNEVEENIKKNGNIESLIELLKRKKGILSFAFIKIVMRYKLLVEEKRSINDMREELLVSSEEAQREYLEEFLPVINTIASVATLLGLLGTIIGMISSFDEIAKGGKGDPSVVAGGISTALLTTAAGLIVAIPAVLSYSFLRRKMEKIIASLEPYSNHFVNYLLRDLARLSTYKAMLITAYRDGVLNADEEKFLKEKRVELNISETEHEKISSEVQKVTV